jgi:hypothetical protein
MQKLKYKAHNFFEFPLAKLPQGYCSRFLTKKIWKKMIAQPLRLSSSLHALIIVLLTCLPKASAELTGFQKSSQTLKESVSRFHLGNHLKKPTSRELRHGVTVSERFEKNPHLIRQGSRDLRAAQPDPEWETGETPIIKARPESDSPPGEIPVITTETMDEMPFGDGPGVLPGFPEGTPGFWQGEEGEPGYATKMWEVVACPVADVQGFLANPMRCFFGDDKSPFSFLSDTVKDTDAIKDITTTIIVDAVSRASLCHEG